MTYNYTACQWSTWFFFLLAITDLFIFEENFKLTHSLQWFWQQNLTKTTTQWWIVGRLSTHNTNQILLPSSHRQSQDCLLSSVAAGQTAKQAAWPAIVGLLQLWQHHIKWEVIHSVLYVYMGKLFGSHSSDSKQNCCEVLRWREERIQSDSCVVLPAVLPVFMMALYSST